MKHHSVPHSPHRYGRWLAAGMAAALCLPMNAHAAGPARAVAYQTAASQTATAPAGQQDHESLRLLAEQFLQAQASSLPGEVQVEIGRLDPRLKLAACADPQAYLPAGGKAWGKTSVGLRCLAPNPWSVFLQAKVALMAEYLVLAKPLAAGQVIAAEHMVRQKGDISALPPGVATDPAQVAGRSAAVALPAGTPLRIDALRPQTAVQQGQMVRLVANGAGFRVTTDARALTTAGDGQPVQVKTANGQQVSGIAKLGGMVEVAF